MKVLTINIWRYYEWEKRKEKLIKFILDLNADIVFLQETAYDERLKDKYQNQVDEINKALGYRDFAYRKLMDMKKWHKDNIDWYMEWGLGILSKFKIKKVERVILNPVVKSKDFGFLYVQLESEKGIIDCINVHFENTDEGSKEQLKKTIEWCNKKKIKPIIAGDFNMKDTNALLEIADSDFKISYKIKEYKSFMPTKFSNNSEPITLDYIIVHKELFEMKNVECIQNDASDHNPVVADINFL